MENDGTRKTIIVRPYACYVLVLLSVCVCVCVCVCVRERERERERESERERTVNLSFFVCKIKACLFAEKFFFKKINSEKVNYFLIFGSLMKNKLENIFQCLIMPWKMSWNITY